MASVSKENVIVLLAGVESTVKRLFLYVKSSALDTELFFWTLEFAAVIPNGQDLTALQSSVPWSVVAMESAQGEYANVKKVG